MSEGPSKEQEYRAKVYAQATEIKTPEALTAFMAELSAHEHDYGTIVYACAAAMKAAWRVVNASPQGGITGFQAGCLMWEMVHELGAFSEGPLRIQDFDNLRYPQYDDDWGVTLSAESAETLKYRAATIEGEGCSPAVLKRNREIAAGRFPAFVTVEAAEPQP